MNVQVLARPDGTALWFSRALPGWTYDLTAARANGVIQACLTRQILVLADRAYRGAGATVRTLGILGVKRVKQQGPPAGAAVFGVHPSPQPGCGWLVAEP